MAFGQNLVVQPSEYKTMLIHNTRMYGTQAYWSHDALLNDITGTGNKYINNM